MTETTPILLITRPRDEADRLIRAVETATPARFEPVVSPLIETVPTGQVVETARWTTAIASSARAIHHARFDGDVRGRAAYCVGERTAKVAEAAGFRAASADGDGTVLVELILAQSPVEPMIYLRGDTVRVDIAQQLRQAGLTCHEAVTYAQRVQALSHQARQILSGDRKIVAPIFSPNAAQAFRNQGPYDAPVAAVALSQAVANELDGMTLLRLTVCARPDLATMVEKVKREIGGNSRASSP